MYEIDKEAFGTFLSQLRKERGMTQRELAEKLFVSDKAVSKWERGLSLPDVALLQPLADLLGVSISELLRGQRIQAEAPMTAREADALVSGALQLTAREQEKQRESRRRWGLRYTLGVLLLAAELLVLWRGTGYLTDNFVSMLLVPLLLAAVFGLYFCFFARERLPAFYDENSISFYSDGPFRMNIPGVHFNNSNWPHILEAVRWWAAAMLALYAPVYVLIRWICGLIADQEVQFAVLMVLCMAILFAGLFLPIYRAGRKYQ